MEERKSWSREIYVMKPTDDRSVALKAATVLCSLELLLLCNSLNNYLGTLPLIYRRYVDDCFLLFGTKAQCNVFFEYLNKQHPNIKFTKEVEQDQSLPFLDIKIKIRMEHYQLLSLGNLLILDFT